MVGLLVIVYICFCDVDFLEKENVMLSSFLLVFVLLSGKVINVYNLV